MILMLGAAFFETSKNAHCHHVDIQFFGVILAKAGMTNLGILKAA